jgi:N-carbamoylputrescine amidase
MRTVSVAATQMACGVDVAENLDRAEAVVRDAAKRGAQIILLQELFATTYFCQEERAKFFELAESLESSSVVQRFSSLARELSVVLPISFFERAGNTFFNSVAVADSDGRILGSYRKSHIPDGPGYEEKFYFSPGDSGFQVFTTAVGAVGVGICWDQWFPECARSMALLGAEILCYPTAIGSEPQDPTLDSSGHWQRVMAGHAAANMVPVIASNRIGAERAENSEITFYGSSFICDATGDKIAEADRVSAEILTATFDLDELAAARASFGLFRDRRPDLYGALLTLDGQNRSAATRALS